jgi:Ca-activated chloride channel family protein
VNFFKSLVNVEVLNKDKKVVKRFKSDRKTMVPTGKWELRIFKDPFYELYVPGFDVYPSGKHEFNVNGIGAVKVVSDDIAGVYVYDENKTEQGNFLSNTTTVLKSSAYTFHMNEQCSFPSIPVKDKKEVLVLTCPKK